MLALQIPFQTEALPADFIGGQNSKRAQLPPEQASCDSSFAEGQLYCCLYHLRRNYFWRDSATGVIECRKLRN